MAAPKNFHTLPYPISTRWLWPETFSDYLCFMIEKVAQIDSAPAMIAAIRQFGVLPFFHNTIEGWSVEELTKPGCWFSDIQDGGTLGPWDWKIDAIQSGEIAYGKYIRRKAGFATPGFYGHLMNWRRAQAKYRISGSMPLRTVDDRLNALMAPVVMDLLRENGSMESGEIRKILDVKVSIEERKKVGGHMEKYLVPKMKKQAMDFILGYLEMGCHVITGDISRVFRGPGNEYNGWQRSSLTTPEALFGKSVEIEPETISAASEPFWAKNIEGFGSAAKSAEKRKPSSGRSTGLSSGSKGLGILPDCSPEESYRYLVSHITGFFPGCEKELDKLLK